MTIILTATETSALYHQRVGRIIRGHIAKPLDPSLLVLTREQAEWVGKTMQQAGAGAELWFAAGPHQYHIERSVTSAAVVVKRSTGGPSAPFHEHHASMQAFATAYGLQPAEPQNAVQAAAGGLTQTAIER